MERHPSTGTLMATLSLEEPERHYTLPIFSRLVAIFRAINTLERTALRLVPNSRAQDLERVQIIRVNEIKGWSHEVASVRDIYGSSYFL